MVLVSLAASFVAPTLITTYERQQVKLEQRLFQEKMQQFSTLAFSQQIQIEITLSGNQYSVSGPDMEEQEFGLEYLFFPYQEISLSPVGIFSTEQLNYFHSGREFQIRLM